MATYLGHQEDSSGNILLPTPHSMATQIEFGTTASQAYAKGAYVVFNNRLCKASTAIASGDTLAIGTNLVQCSIGSELNSHLQAPNGNEFYFDYKDNKPGFYPSASKVASEFVPFGGSQSGSFTINNTNPVTINIGKRPTHVCIYMIANASGHYDVVLYDVNYSSTKWANVSAGVGSFVGQTTLGTAMNYHTFNITDTGFTVSTYAGATLYGTYYYIAD